jgi:hypothetical protein
MSKLSIDHVPTADLRKWGMRNVNLLMKGLDSATSDEQLKALIEGELSTNVSSRMSFQATLGRSKPKQASPAHVQNEMPTEPTASSPSAQTDESGRSQPNRAERALQQRDREQDMRPVSTGRAARALDLVYGPKNENGTDSRGRTAKALEAAGFKVRLNKPTGLSEGRS